ncbi:MAG: lipid-A-disaccharide synthase [Rhodobiaceae bacterium]|nr:lipid-A-disaccharide synthase [Rhodobiaceae bacterium]
MANTDRTRDAGPQQGGGRTDRHFFLVAGEPSGDMLGASLMEALAGELGGAVRFSGIGGEHMRAQGMDSLFPLSEMAVMGPVAIARRIVPLLRRIRQTAEAAIASDAEALVIIDSPEFTHRVARRVRARRPSMKIINYVSPTVWAWRPGRAKAMRGYVDHVLAVFPFEPAVMAELDGPPCSYVGHPLAARIDQLRGTGQAALSPPVLVVLPGSRVSEVSRLMAPFGETVARAKARLPDLRVILPAVSSVRRLIETEVKTWDVQPEIVGGEAAKLAAFHAATAALAASGTVSLELALARVPMVIGYRVEPLMVLFRFLLRLHSVVMANLILGRNAIPELLQEKCIPDLLTAALLPLLTDTPQRRAQISALEEVADKVRTSEQPPTNAARQVLALTGKPAP